MDSDGEDDGFDGGGNVEKVLPKGKKSVWPRCKKINVIRAFCTAFA